MTNDRTGQGMSVGEGVCTSLAHIEQLRQENAALKQRIEQMEWER